jgi:hypothetical protein
MRWTSIEHEAFQEDKHETSAQITPCKLLFPLLTFDSFDLHHIRLIGTVFAANLSYWLCY